MRADYLFVAALRCVFVVFSLNSGGCLDVQLLGFDFHIAAAWLVRGILQGTNFRTNRFQIWRRHVSHLDLVHWY